MENLASSKRRGFDRKRVLLSFLLTIAARLRAKFLPSSVSKSSEINGPIMIIARSPLRISLGGGGTDLPSYYEEHTGFLIAAAIDPYVYITLHETFVPDLIVKYSKLERVAKAAELA